MLVAGTFVQVSSNGNAIPVEDLMIGSRVYEPILRKEVEVIDILARSIFVDGTVGALNPITIRYETISGRIPLVDTWFSPSQMLLIPKRMNSMPRVSMVECRAKDISNRQETTPRTVNYFALFLAKKGHIVANGIFAQAYTVEDVWKW